MRFKLQKGLIFIFLLLTSGISISFPLVDPVNVTGVVIHGLFFLITFVGYFYICRLEIGILTIGWQITVFGFFIHTFDEFFNMTDLLEIILEGVLTAAGLFLVALGIIKAVKKFQEYSNRYLSIFSGEHKMLLIDPATGAIIDANQAALSFYGYTREEFLKKKISQIRISTEEDTTEKMNQARKKEKNIFISRHRLANGEIRDVEVYSGPILIEGKELLYSIVHDITDRIRAQKSLEESERKYRTLFNRANDAIFLLEYTEEKGFGNIMAANKAAYDRLGYKEDELINLSPKKLIAGFEIDSLAQITDRLKEEGKVVFQITQLTKNGREIPAEVNAHLCTIENKPAVLAISRDISERKKNEEKLEYLSFHDELTDLYNRRFLEKEINRLNKSRYLPVSIIVTDMDKFKEINDKFGHKIGDIALKITASIIEDAVGEEDIVARLGGDEFAVILPGADQKTAAGVCKEIERRIEEYNKNSKIKIAVSTGYATRDDSATGLDKVLIEADKMMYRNKRAKQADN